MSVSASFAAVCIPKKSDDGWMLSPNRSENRTCKTNRTPNVPQKQLEQQKRHKQLHWDLDNPLGEESASIGLSLLLNKPTNTGVHSSSANKATSQLPLPSQRSATTSLSSFPITYQRITQQEAPSDRRARPDLLRIKVEALSKPYWKQASLSVFAQKTKY